MESSNQQNCLKCNKHISSNNVKLHESQCKGTQISNLCDDDIFISEDKDNLINKEQEININSMEDIKNNLHNNTNHNDTEANDIQQNAEISDLYYCKECDSYMALSEKEDHLFSHQIQNPQNYNVNRNSSITGSIHSDFGEEINQELMYKNLNYLGSDSSIEHGNINNFQNNILSNDFNSPQRIIEEPNGVRTDRIFGPGLTNTEAHSQNNVRNIISHSNYQQGFPGNFINPQSSNVQEVDGIRFERTYDPLTDMVTVRTTGHGFNTLRTYRQNESNGMDANLNPPNFVIFSGNRNNNDDNNFSNQGYANMFPPGFPFHNSNLNMNMRMNQNPFNNNNSQINSNPFQNFGRDRRVIIGSRNDLNGIFGNGIQEMMNNLFGGINLDHLHLQREDHTALIDSLPEMTVDENSKLPKDKNECIICMSSFQINEKVKIMPCTHFFHTDCIRQWFRENDSCPICKNVVN